MNNKFKLSLDPSLSKTEVLRRVKQLIKEKGFIVADADEQKPWGAYYRFRDQHSKQFLKDYFPDQDLQKTAGSFSPKFLIFQPGKKLSFQYHHRRAEIWKVLHGKLEASITDQDHPGEYRVFQPGDQIYCPVQARHRAGAPAGGEWSVVAEVWQHIDPKHPSDEQDIVRLMDDFGRA